MRRNHVLWYALFVGCLTLSVFLFAFISIGTSASSVVNPCTQSRENADFSCNSGENEDPFPIPTPQSTGAYINIQASDREMSGIRYRGVSLAGGHCTDKLGAQGEFMPVDNDATPFIYAGMNVMRIPIRWENIADQSGNFLNSGNTMFVQKLDKLIRDLTALNMTIILDLYNNMHYNGVFIRQPVVLLGLYTLWYQLAKRYNGPNMIYAVMTATQSYNNNEHQEIYTIMDVAIRGIAEAEGGKLRHFVILPSVYLDFMSDDRFRPPTLHRDILPAYKNHPLLKEEEKNYAIDVAVSYARVVVTEERNCYSLSLRILMNRNYARVQNWTLHNRFKLFVTLLGVPTISPECISLLRYSLSYVFDFPYNSSGAAAAGIIGWTAWGGAYPHCDASPVASGPPYPENRRRPYYTLSPGYTTNNLLKEFAPYLHPIDTPMPPLNENRLYVRFRNNLDTSITLVRGYVPFQVKGATGYDVPPDQEGFIYSNSNTSIPTGNLQTLYVAEGYPGLFGFTYTQSYNYVQPSIGAGNCIQIVPDYARCGFLGITKGGVHCYLINKATVC